MKAPTGLFFENLEIGLAKESEHHVDEAAVALFADASGDHNPLHLDAEYAATTQFGERIAHGMLSAAYISALLGMEMPGPGSIYLGQTLKFRAPVKLGDTVTARVEIIALDVEKNRATVATTCRVGETVVVKGEALILVPSRS
jgi:3-hydroxybutyryl-CoA dehydratase